MITIASFAGDRTISVAIADGLAEASGIDLRFTTTRPRRRHDRVDPLGRSKVGVTAVVGVGGIAGSTAGALACVGATVATHFAGIKFTGSTAVSYTHLTLPTKA